ncbi:MAG: hypothetical protein AB8B72_06135 [Crocinitomicaceae bacterium]
MKCHFLKFVFFLLSFGSFFSATSQVLNLSKKDSIKGDFTAFSVDNIGNVYLSHQDVITKLNVNLDTIFSTSLKAHFPTFIQAVKNFRILTFDQERGIVQFFDNTLTPLTDGLNLYDLDMVQPILVCESFNGNSFWVLDAGTLRLLKVNEAFKVITEIENLSFLTSTEILPTEMIEYNDLLYILIPNQYILVFDAFGTLIQKLPTKTEWISIYKNAILQFNFPYFQFVNKLLVDSEMACKWPLPDIKSFHISNKFLFVLTKSGFFRGKINQPTPAKNN